MDTVKKLIITAVMLMCSLSVYAQSAAGREIANIQSWLNEGSQGFYKPGTGDQWVRNVSGNGDRFIKVESTIDYKASNGRNYPVPIEKTGQIDGSKIGKAMVTLAKFVGPLALGFQIYSAVCELSDICKKDGSDEWEKVTQDYELLDSSTNTSDCSSIPEGASYIDYSPGNYLEIQRIDSYVHCPGNPNLSNQGYTLTNYCSTPGGSCAYQAIWQKNVSTLPETQKIPVTEQDWTNAETSLNDPRFDEPLLVNGQPVPLANLPILGNVPPITISDTETINRDSQGNVTGTTRTTTTLEVTDSATTERPGSVTGTETTVKTDYNTSGQPTGTQTSINTPPPPDKPQEPPTISFDNAEGLPIETEVVNLQLPAAVSWGEGTCPADVPLPFNNLSIPYQPACDAAMQLRPVVIFLASISALLIISGLRESKS